MKTYRWGLLYFTLSPTCIKELIATIKTEKNPVLRLLYYFEYIITPFAALPAVFFHEWCHIAVNVLRPGVIITGLSFAVLSEGYIVVEGLATPVIRKTKSGNCYSIAGCVSALTPTSDTKWQHFLEWLCYIAPRIGFIGVIVTACAFLLSGSVVLGLGILTYCFWVKQGFDLGDTDKEQANKAFLNLMKLS